MRSVLATVVLLAGAVGGDPVLEDFEKAPLDAPPPGFTVASTLGNPDLVAKAVKWLVVEDASAPSGKRILKLAETANRDEIMNLLLRDEAAPADLCLSVKLRADAGEEDRGGGLVWRAIDEQNYYVTRWNPLENNLRIYRCVKGRRLQLQSVPIKADDKSWHTLEVTMRGRVIEVAFDGEKVASCADTHFPAVGKIGLWTRSNAQSSFDDLSVKAAPEERKTRQHPDGR
ncbi:MAG: hypothetical protein EXS13_09505 [Planctomycetes bacterium]|nr:hypothetical protein [Planctomycetota bacterium]